jgi:two-component system OmpR family response regulator
MKILIIEDDKKIASFIGNGFKQAGFAVDIAKDGAIGLKLMLTKSYDAAVIDVMLPKLDGLTLLECARKRNVNTPVIILSAKRTVDDRIIGLQKGGDDYLVKPYAFSELFARVQALMRRSTGSTEATYLEFDSLSIDLLARKVVRGDKEINLQPKEFSLLEYFLRNVGRVLSKTMIMEHIWGYDFDPQTNVVDVLVCRLRDKIDRDFEKKVIHTIRGIGYVLKES